ncbi:factor associated with neutral sphingomyelinase activation [Marchantia polymorpha subsp. ruderalis]|uniref:BEACH domain-containing protein n=2 Tax=Marchantia polymorpha TaxID=3197 RepID=A0AAF6AVV2_MARPO|nr:hypothetical protein MARPO_0007s0030 [Marchantia polymorpha]BBN03886.1 hypothetical protein Mp_3g00330 [Marchantia polymorpha subsp. ruderalis]|eukprot:PTQ47575.1 hypothetical protein MARPO_0007s0030 [Marchantia polymorpha]
MWPSDVGKHLRRFSYLLMEEGDHYIQDWIATCRQGSAGGSQRLQAQAWQQRSLRGRLRLCAKCLFFEPDYGKAPILMFRFTDVKKIEQFADPPSSPLSVGKWNKRQEGFAMETSMSVEMKENGLDAPYIFQKRVSIWWFTLEYSTVQPLLQQVQSLLSINALPYAERNMVLQNAAAQREAQAQFDISRLVDLSERIILDYTAAQVTPLVREPGRVVLTQARLYFQPLHNLNNDNPVRSHPFSSIVAVARRRHALRHIGMEVFFKDEGQVVRNISSGTFTGGASVFYTFQSVQKRDAAVSTLLEQLGGHKGAAAEAGSLLEADGCWLQRLTAAWQARLVSNYDYLVYLNLAAGRSFCDLTQWPVMPWVLSDYKSKILDLSDPSVFRDLSKPIGALNPSRLALFQQRYLQMPQGDPSSPPFLYGTHYSTPGYVLYWVVRSAPAHMLRLQNGRFDAPDRLFVSMSESWDSVLSNHADLKELIPEFYSPPSEFLTIRNDLNLGVRQNGTAVGDVVLPPWAKSPDDFIEKHRQALESEHVSMHVHQWIDLIFGYKQRGEAALAADNLFHHLTYEGAVDLEKIDDPTQRAGIEAQINEFGQAPRQLFTSFHPARFQRSKRRNLTISLANNPHGSDENSGGLSPNFLSRIMALASSPNVDPIEDMEFCSRDSIPGTPSQVSELSVLTSPDSVGFGKAEFTRTLSLKSSVEWGSDESTSDVQDVDELKMASLTEREESFADSALYGERPPAAIQKADENAEAFRSLTLSEGPDVSLEDTTVGITIPVQGFSNFEENFKTKGVLPWFQMFRQRLSEPQSLKLHRGPVNALTLSADNASESLTMYSVGKDGFIKVYSISEGFQVRATKLGNLPLAAVALAASSDAYPTVLAGSYDDCVYAYSVDYGRALGKIRVHDDTVSCVEVAGTGNLRMITGSWDATVKVWSIEEGRGGWAASFSSVSGNTERVPDCEIFEHEVAVWSLDVSENGHLAVSGAEDGTVKAWDLRASTSSVWQYGAGTNAITGLRLTDDSSNVVVASTDGSLRVLEMRRSGAELASKDCGSPLKCCDIAGPLVIAGSEDGALHFWPFGLQDPSGSSGELEVANEFLDYSPFHDHTDALNCISIGRGSHGCDATLASASDDCTIQVYRTGQT